LVRKSQVSAESRREAIKQLPVAANPHAAEQDGDDRAAANKVRVSRPGGS
jgi:hypothetical protein